MKITNILIILVLLSFVFGQSGNNNADVLRVKDSPVKNNNTIDLQTPPQKIKAQRMANPNGELRKQNRAMGSAKTSGPAQILQNDNIKVTVSDADLKQHLHKPKLLKPLK